MDPLTPDGTALTGTASQVTITTTQQGSTLVDGAFQLLFTDSVAHTLPTRLLSPHESPQGVKQTLEALASVGTVLVTRQETSDGYAWRITFDHCRTSAWVCNIGDVPSLTSDTTALTGGYGALGPTVTIAEIVKGTTPIGITTVTDLSGGDPFEWRISSLTVGTTYYTRVAFRNAVSLGPYALSIPNAVQTKYLAPNAPESVALVTSSASSLTVPWSMPTQNGGSPVRGYELCISDCGQVYRKVYDRPNDLATFHTTLTTTADNELNPARSTGSKCVPSVRAMRTMPRSRAMAPLVSQSPTRFGRPWFRSLRRY